MGQTCEDQISGLEKILAILTAGWWFFVEFMYVNMYVEEIQNDKLGRLFFYSKIKQQKILFEGAQGFVARST